MSTDDDIDLNGAIECKPGESLIETVKAARAKQIVDHPRYETIMDINKRDFVVCFKTGKYVMPDAEARAAWDRIHAAISTPQMEADRAIVAKWHGNLVFYTMQGYAKNPEVTDAEREEMVKAACAAFPDCGLHGSWDNMSNGTSGFSVRLARKTKES